MITIMGYTNCRCYIVVYVAGVISGRCMIVSCRTKQTIMIRIGNMTFICMRFSWLKNCIFFSSLCNFFFLYFQRLKKQAANMQKKLKQKKLTGWSFVPFILGIAFNLWSLYEGRRSRGTGLAIGDILVVRKLESVYRNIIYLYDTKVKWKMYISKWLWKFLQQLL